MTKTKTKFSVADVARMAADCATTFGWGEKAQATHDQLEFHLSAASSDRRESDDYQDPTTGLWYPSVATWDAIDASLKDFFPEWIRHRGMREHPSRL